MRIGLFLTPQYPRGANLSRATTDVLEQVRAARANGFSSVLVGQHMVTGPDMQMLQLVPLMARLIPETEGMQIGAGVMLLPMLSPVLVAEEGATLDWMSNGNYVLACGLGYRHEEFEAMGTRRSHRVPRLEESLDVVKRLWTEERITHHGAHFHLTNVGASVRPKQRPRPPIWLGGDVEPAIRRAGRLADAWLGSPTSTVAQLQSQMSWFHESFRASGRGKPGPCPVIRECFVGRDMARAKSVSRGPLLYKYEAYASWGHNDSTKAPLAERFDEFCEDRFLIGDVSHVRDEIRRIGETVNTDHLVLRLQWPGLAHQEVLGSIERLGQVLSGL